MNTSGIWSEKLRCSGKPCIRGQRFPISQLVAELADGRPLKEIAEDFDIDYDKIKLAWTDLVDQLCQLKINSQYIMSDPETRGWTELPSRASNSDFSGINESITRRLDT